MTEMLPAPPSGTRASVLPAPRARSRAPAAPGRPIGLMIQGDDDYGVGRVAREIAALVPGIRCVAFSPGSECDDIAAAGVSVSLLRGGGFFRGFAPRRGLGAAMFQLWRAQPHLRACARELGTWCRREGVRVLHGNVWAHYLVLGALRRGVPGEVRTIWHVHNFLNVHRHGGVPARFCWRQARRGADWILAVSHAVVGGWAASGVPSRVIHNAVPLRHMRLPLARPPRSRPPDAPVRLVGAGRMEPCKGHHVTIEAVGRLRERGWPVTLDLFGGPRNSYHEALGQQIRALSLDDVVQIHGYVNDLAERLHGYDAAIQSRIDPEPFGLFVAEAMHRGLPVIASANGGVLELVRDGKDGRLYPSGDVTALANGIEAIVREPLETERMAQSARERAQRDFGPAVFARNLRAFYAELLNTAHGVAPSATASVWGRAARGEDT